MTENAYHYEESGLDNIWLQNGYELDSEGGLSIENIHGLHAAIAESLVFAPRKLSGKEIRFIRHFLDWSQKGLGERLRVDYQTVLRWENEKVEIPDTTETFLRGILYEYLKGDAKMIDLIETLSDMDNNRNAEPIEFALNDNGWQHAA